MDYLSSSSDEGEEIFRQAPCGSHTDGNTYVDPIIQFGRGENNYEDYESNYSSSDDIAPALPPLEILEERMGESQSRNSRTLEVTVRFTAPDPNDEEVSPMRTLETAITEIFR